MNSGRACDKLLITTPGIYKQMTTPHTLYLGLRLNYVNILRRRTNFCGFFLDV